MDNYEIKKDFPILENNEIVYLWTCRPRTSGKASGAGHNADRP